MAKKRAATVARGAVIERSLIQQKLSRMTKAADDATTKNGAQIVGYLEALNELRAWLKAQPARTKKPGGIGR